MTTKLIKKVQERLKQEPDGFVIDIALQEFFQWDTSFDGKDGELINLAVEYYDLKDAMAKVEKKAQAIVDL